VIHKSRLERSLLLSTNEERQRMKNSVLNKIQTLQIHCYAVWAQECPVTFQRLINDTLREYLDDFAITYLDDILIYSDDLEMHCSHVHKVLKSSMKGFCMWRSQKQVWSKENQIPNYVIQSEQIKKNSKKTDAVRNWPSSKWVKKVQAFLELMNYYQKFVPNYAKIAEPLTTNAQEQEMTLR
jgi:hypothetical protein